jgi:outer membrane protein with beta-barrel domain
MLIRLFRHMRSLARFVLTLLAVLLTMFALPSAAFAQDRQPEDLPIGHYVADVRLYFPKFKQDPAVSGAIGVATENLPTRGFGFGFGAHWYPLRFGFMTLGVGGEISKSGRDKTMNTGTEAAPVNVTVNTRFSAVSPQVSFNFGARDGWSYISGGLGWSTLTTEDVAHPIPDPDSATKTINYGGGARWFFKKHLAVNFDIRFHAVNPQLATATRPAYPRMTIMSWVGGISLR